MKKVNSHGGARQKAGRIPRAGKGSKAGDRVSVYLDAGIKELVQKDADKLEISRSEMINRILRRKYAKMLKT